MTHCVLRLDCVRQSLIKTTVSYNGETELMTHELLVFKTYSKFQLLHITTLLELLFMKYWCRDYHLMVTNLTSKDNIRVKEQIVCDFWQTVILCDVEKKNYT